LFGVLCIGLPLYAFLCLCLPFASVFPLPFPIPSPFSFAYIAFLCFGLLLFAFDPFVSFCFSFLSAFTFSFSFTLVSHEETWSFEGQYTFTVAFMILRWVSVDLHELARILRGFAVSSHGFIWFSVDLR
jgi:hypothetical protein